MINKIIHIKEDNLEKSILEIKELFLVDFWAEWCSPCKIVAPILEETANDLFGKLVVAKINIDENPVSTKKYGIRSIPTLLLFKNNQLLANKVGTFSKKELKNFISVHL